MTSEREVQIAQRRAEMPRSYRACYDKAVSGKSRKAAMHAFCNECCGWQIKEVFLCTDLGCPLYSYRPRSRVSQEGPESIPQAPEPEKSSQDVPEAQGAAT